MSRPRVSRRWLRLLAAAAGITLVTVGGLKVRAALSDGPTSVPSCSWPLRVRGRATAEQAGLIRCYLRALAGRDIGGLQAVADDDPPVRISGAELAHSGDAKTGLATASFVPNPSDDAFTTVHIKFADGTRANVAILLANPASAHSWRIQIGSPADQDAGAPAPARPSP